MGVPSIVGGTTLNSSKNRNGLQPRKSSLFRVLFYLLINSIGKTGYMDGLQYYFFVVFLYKVVEGIGEGQGSHLFSLVRLFLHGEMVSTVCRVGTFRVFRVGAVGSVQYFSASAAVVGVRRLAISIFWYSPKVAILTVRLSTLCNFRTSFFRYVRSRFYSIIVSRVSRVHYFFASNRLSMGASICTIST